MNEGTLNEVKVFQAIPKFMEYHSIEDTASVFSMNSHEPIFEKYRVDYIRCVGLLVPKTAPMLRDSSDGLLGYYTTSDVY